jgi:hypothetical protein
MKYFKFLLLPLTLLVAYEAISLTRPMFLGDTCTTGADTLNYILNISESQLTLLKDTVFNGKKCLITHCPLTLINNSNDSLKYMAMSSSWWDLYTLDNKNFAFAEDYWNVFKNGPEVLVLPPHQPANKSIPIITYKNYYRGEKVRIAMSLQRLGFELPDLKMYAPQLMPKTTNMIWSNTVTIH